MMVERTVERGREDAFMGVGEEERGGGGGGAVEEAGVEVGELRLDEDGEDFRVPLAWFWILE